MKTCKKLVKRVHCPISTHCLLKPLSNGYCKLHQPEKIKERIKKHELKFWFKTFHEILQDGEK